MSSKSAQKKIEVHKTFTKILAFTISNRKKFENSKITRKSKEILKHLQKVDRIWKTNGQTIPTLAKV